VAEKKKTPDKATLGRFKKKIAAKAGVKKTEAKRPVKKPEEMHPLSSLYEDDSDGGFFQEDKLIKLSSKTLPDTVNRYSHIITRSEILKEDTILVSEIYPDYDSDSLYHMTYAYLSDPTRTRSRCIPGDFKFSEVKDAKLLKKYDSWKLRHLDEHLYHDWTIGSDPEIFVEDKKGDLIPAFLFLGSKEERADRTPSRPPFYHKGGHPMYWDGFQAEFTTLPETCLGWQMDSIAAGMYGVYEAAKKKFPDARLSIKSVFDIPPDLLQKAEKKYVEFGCMPSINAYGLKVRMPPARKVTFRSAGGHLHFGIGKISKERAIPIVKALDGILGVACVSLFAKYDDPKRRRLYGVPGEFRLPPHGMEYRPLSNAWLCHPFISNLVIDLARKVVVLGQKDLYNRVWKATEKETVETIIRCDVKKAREILSKNKDVFISILKAAYKNEMTNKKIEFLYSIFANGMESFIRDPSDIVNNWGLDKEWLSHSGGTNMNVGDAMENVNMTKTRKI
jgi:hypothetical protein